MSSKKILISIPCLNEGESIRQVVENLPKTIENISQVQVLVIDDGSTDNTATEGQAAGAHVISHGFNRGLGVAFQTTIEYALEQDFDYLVTIDGDGQFNAADISKLLSPLLLQNADFVTASRFIDKEFYPQGIPPAKFWGNQAMSWLISKLTGKKFLDVSCGFRAYSKKSLMHLNLQGKFTYTQEVFLDLCFKGMRIAEIPVHVKYMKNRKSRMASSLVKYGFNTSKIIIRTYRDFYPLKFFWFFSLIFLLVGSAFSAITLKHYIETTYFVGKLWAAAIGGFFIFLSIAFWLLGLVVDMLERLRLNQEKILFHLKKRNKH